MTRGLCTQLYLYSNHTSVSFAYGYPVNNNNNMRDNHAINFLALDLPWALQHTNIKAPITAILETFILIA